MIFVFLSRKLITLDTILPLLHELKLSAPRTRVEFLCFDTATERTIRENVVLYDLVQKLGCLRMIGRWDKRPLGMILHRIWAFGVLLRIVLWMLNPRSRLVHFKALNEWPLRLFHWIAPARTVLVQPSALTFSVLERKVDQINKSRRYKNRIPAAGCLVGFQSNWPPLSVQELENLPRYLVPEPYTLPNWRRYLRQAAPDYLQPIYEGFGGKPKSFAVFVLSSMDRAPMLSDPDSFPALFRETLEILANAAPDLCLAVKPHPATVAATRSLIADALRSQRAAGQKVFETHLHPLLLAQEANFFVANCFSHSLANAFAAGVPTIEYTRYSDEVLRHTGGGSFRPELVTHFINGDAAKLKSVVSDLTRTRPVSAPIGSTAGEPELTALLAYLDGGAARSARPAGVKAYQH